MSKISSKEILNKIRKEKSPQRNFRRRLKGSTRTRDLSFQTSERQRGARNNPSGS